MGDLRYSLRVLLRRPAFSGMVVGILALGIGANTAVFSLIYGILLRPFPYREPDRLVQIQSQYTKTSGNIRGNSLPDIDDWHAQSRTVSDVGGYLAGPVSRCSSWRRTDRRCGDESTVTRPETVTVD
jgi:hypothetical protein